MGERERELTMKSVVLHTIQIIVHGLLRVFASHYNGPVVHNNNSVVSNRIIFSAGKQANQISTNYRVMICQTIHTFRADANDTGVNNTIEVL